MIFFSLFVISAVILGAAAMLAPAWPTAEPRIGLTATLLLGLIAGGAVWWANLFGWDTLIIDYLLFGIVSGVILGGTMSQGRGDAGWPSRADLVFLGLAALICMMPLFILRLPLGEQAASDALITLSVRESGSFTSLSPFYPEVLGFAPPAFHALAAYLSQQLRQEIPTIHMALGSLIAFLSVWTVYDLGAEIRDKALGRGMAIALVASFGMLGLLWGSYYSQLMGVLFAFAFITYASRYYRQHKLVDMVAAGLMLGAVLYASPMLFAICLFGYYLAVFFPRRVQKPAKPLSEWTRFSQIGLWFGVLVVCLFAILPMLAKNWQFISADYFQANPDFLVLSNDKETWLQCLYTLSASILGAYIVRWLTKRLELCNCRNKVLGVALLGLTVMAFYFGTNIPNSATENDIAAMEWLVKNAPDQSLVLNHPYLNYYISELPLAYPFQYFPSFWLSSLPIDKQIYTVMWLCYSCNNITYYYYNIREIRDPEIDYVIVPDGYAFPQDIDGLRLVFEQGGARVYEVIHGE